jgi:16S rRNA (guanine1207-N2)-methyltransferase
VTGAQHYFAAQPTAAHRPGTVRVVLPDVYLELATDSGMFSPGRLDPGTRFLLEAAPPPPASGDLLDLGCGYGPIACVLAARAPGATVWAVDVNERALALCAANAAAAGLANVRCALPSDPGLPSSLAGIWSNPPVRIGKAALHALLLDWLGRLAPGAAATLVMGRNLGSDSLHAWLAEQGWPATRLSARSGYRLLRVDDSAGTERMGVAADGD